MQSSFKKKKKESQERKPLLVFTYIPVQTDMNLVIIRAPLLLIYSKNLQ